MNQGELEVVKQEMARVNIDILGIFKLKWTGIGEFNSDDHYIYYRGQESLRRNGVIVNKRVRNAVLGRNLKNDRMISVFFQGKPFNIMVLQVYVPISNAEEAQVEQFYEDLQDLLELIPKKRSRAKGNGVLPRECTGQSKHPLPTTQEKTLYMDITRCQHQNQIDYILSCQRWRSYIHSAKTRPGADCGSDHELLIAKFRLKLKKVGKTTRPFSYDLNQIPYDYTVEVRNRFKGLDLIDREPNELWTKVRDIIQKTGIKTIPMEKKCKKAKWLSEKAFQIAVKRREAKSKGEKERYSQSSKE